VRRSLPLRAEMLKYLMISCFHLVWNILLIAEQRSVHVVKNRGKTGREMAHPWENSNIYTVLCKSRLVARIAFLSLPGPALKQNQQTLSPPFWFVCLLFQPISELIHLVQSRSYEGLTCVRVCGLCKLLSSTTSIDRACFREGALFFGKLEYSSVRACFWHGPLSLLQASVSISPCVFSTRSINQQDLSIL